MTIEHPSFETILKERILIDGETNYEDVCTRVSNFIFQKDNEKEDRDKLFTYMMNRVIIPASPYLMQAGTKRPQVCSCFVVDVEDTLESIYQAIAHSAKIFQYSGGVGINWSNLRPEGSPLSGGGTSSGVIPFLREYNQMVEAVKSGGRKKGAAIAILDINHGDIEKFITMKNTEGELNNINISVRITDDFINRYINNDSEAVRLMNLIAQSIWTRAEPGILFGDTIETGNRISKWKPIRACNPCGELVMPPYGSCNLIGIDVSKITSMEMLEDVMRLCVRAGDNAIDLCMYPLKEIEETSKYIRQLGIYPMGVADLLINNGLAYDSEQGRQHIFDMWRFALSCGRDESIKLGKLKGVAPVVQNGYWSEEWQPRNTTINSAAPSGTTSLIANCSSGIEPVFSFVATRTSGCGSGKYIVHPLFDSYIKDNHLNIYYDIMDYMHKNGSIQNYPIDDPYMKSVFKTALDISPTDHVLMQGKLQMVTDTSLSKTINCPESTKPSEILETIIFAWKSGCKGLTFYRQNSRKEVVYDLKKSVEPLIKIEEINNPVKYKLVTATEGRILPKTPRDIPASLYKRNSGCGKLMVSIGEVDEKPHSVTIVNKGGCDAMTQALAELTSLCERFGIPAWNINKVLMNIKCSAAMKNPNSDGKSCPDILGKILNEYPHDEEPSKDSKQKPIEKKKKAIQSIITCPECGEGVVFESGCVSCPSCGYARCG